MRRDEICSLKSKTNRIQPLMLCSLLLFHFLVSGQELLPMPRPTHSDEGVVTSRLVKIKEMEPDYGNDVFFAVPWYLTVSKEYIYVYDAKLAKCFIFDSKYNFVKKFLKTGVGPGEISSGNSPGKMMKTAPDGTLWISDFTNDRLNQFSPAGKHIKDYRMHRLGKARGGFPPVIDNEGYLYAFSTHKGIVDKIRLSTLKRVHTYLDMEENGKCAVFRSALKEKYTRWGNIELWLQPDHNRVMYDITADGYLIIYLFRSSRAFIFCGTKLVRQFDILIDRVLPVYRKRAEEAYMKQKKVKDLKTVKIALMFHSVFVDKDEPYFYLQFLEPDSTISLFRFDLTGSLTGVIKNTKADIKAKQNGLFYGFGPGRNPVVFKKEE